MFSVPALHTRTYPPYNSQSVNKHSFATLVCLHIFCACSTLHPYLPGHPIIRKCMDMHSLATLGMDCIKMVSHLVNYRWNMEIAGQNVLFWMGSIKRLDLQTTYRYRAKHFRIYSYWSGLPYFVVTRSENMRVSHSGTSNVKILEIFKHFWPASEPCK